jgi:hypothetical protein
MFDDGPKIILVRFAAYVLLCLVLAFALPLAMVCFSIWAVGVRRASVDTRRSFCFEV